MKILTWPVVAGAALGIVAPLLTYNGNPGNMGFCAACFLRDTAGSLGLHHAAPLQYLRPELIGLVLGALASAFLSKEFKPRGGSAPLARISLGFFAMLGLAGNNKTHIVRGVSAAVMLVNVIKGDVVNGGKTFA